MAKAQHILVFGGRGAIGDAVRRRYLDLGWDVTATSRSTVAAADDAARWIVCDPSAGFASTAALDASAPYSAVCWAQGANMSDSVFNVDADRHITLYRANCVFVLETLRVLLDRSLLAPAARMVVVSSIWQRIARQDKLSYIMSKAAVGGLVQSASVDLAAKGMLINAVLPSALDTPMTAANMSEAQMTGLKGATGFGRLTSVDEVTSTIEFLCSERNTGITGQSVTVDLGFSHARLV